MHIDFTLTAYRQLLLAIKQSGYAFYTFEDWCEGKATGRFVILRHDVDLKARNSLIIARIEAKMGIRATYYFRVVPQSNQPDIISPIINLGHEIGYHYEDLSIFHGNSEKAIEHFKIKLEYFRQFYPVRTICMHGSPTSKWNNRDLWNLFDYKDYGVIGEPYFDLLSTKSNLNFEVKYFTDTARMWDGDRFNLRDKLLVNSESLVANTYDCSKNSESIISKIHSTYDFVDWLKTTPNQNVLMITTHPQRWTNNHIDWIFELIKQNIKNLIKKFIVINHQSDKE
jgi:hypothetical protein